MLSEKKLDDLSVPFAGLGGIEDYRGYARAIEQAAIAEQAAPAGEAIGEMRENGVTWFQGNPHSFPVGTMFYTGPQPSECNRCAELAAKNTQLGNELKDVDATLNDPRVNMTITTTDAVKELQAKVAKLTAERDEAQDRCNEGGKELARAEAVIEKVDQFIQSPISLRSCEEMNKAIYDYRDYTIADYQKGVK